MLVVRKPRQKLFFTHSRNRNSSNTPKIEECSTRRTLLHLFTVQRVNCKMGAIWATEFFETKDALYGNGTNREIRSFAWNHSHNNAVINRRARAKAALHIISHQHKLLEASLLKARQNVSADADAFVLQACHAIGQKTAGEGISLFNFKLTNLLFKQMFRCLAVISNIFQDLLTRQIANQIIILD